MAERRTNGTSRGRRQPVGSWLTGEVEEWCWTSGSTVLYCTVPALIISYTVL